MAGRFFHLARLLTTPAICLSTGRERQLIAVQHRVDREAFSHRKSLRFASDWKPDARRVREKKEVSCCANHFPLSVFKEIREAYEELSTLERQARNKSTILANMSSNIQQGK